MSKFQSRLLFWLVMLTLFVMIGMGGLIGQIFKAFYTVTYNERLEKEANLVLQIIEKEVDIQIKDVANSLKTKVTMVDGNGEILLSSEENLDDTPSYLINEYKSRLTEGKLSEKPLHIEGSEKNRFYYVVPMKSEGYLLLSQPVDSYEKTYKQIWAVLITSIGLAFIVMLIFGARITRYYMKPIESATIVATELAKGNYKARTYENHSKETSMLSQSINILARNLQDMVKTQEIQQSRLTTLIENMGSGLIFIDSRGYINLVNRTYKDIFKVDTQNYLYRSYYDVIEHREVISMLEEIFMTEIKIRKHLHLSFGITQKHFEVYGSPIISANDEWKGILLVFHDISDLKKLEQIRQDFVANVSHELKTPITSIKGFSETLLDGAMKDENLLENFLNIILTESDRLQSLIQDLLDLSKIEQPGYAINWKRVELRGLIEEIMVLLEGKAAEKNVQLVLEGKGEYWLDGDLYRLKQIFINLINNGIAYTPSGGTVSIAIQELSKKIKVQVLDTGIGIAKEELPRIFERFYRVDKARTRNSGGTGLGLAIVKHLVDVHGGTIMVESEQSVGTTFTIEFNKKKRN
ncbi:two-component system histidine kinase PnpS [Bacillus suaedaesalsae]|uniref:histidine kinase n=1 Tax=Bacillus suaedaesalsae TaxID=2810349 RepID=A0ABS2DG84_9BACI|nr:ATP-binding protein [Bacillus suaedaesalsae]MBM6617496.1 PAS domain-containing protein [Bacillus suaedaesalsae]